MQLFNIFVLLSDQQKKVDGEVIRRIQTILKRYLPICKQKYKYKDWMDEELVG